MSILYLLLFFSLIAFAFASREYILSHIIPKIFNLGFLSKAFISSALTFAVIYSLLSLSTEAPIFDGSISKTDWSSNFLDCIYFSFISQLTIGYGDIHPAHPVSKLLSVIQGLMGTIFMGGLVACLLDFSKNSLNYLFISKVRFIHIHKDSNHGKEVFNLDLMLHKSPNTIFGEFILFLTILHPDGRKEKLIKLDFETVNSSDQLQKSVSDPGCLPRLISKHGRLAYETIVVAPQFMTSRGLESKGLPVFEIHRLLIEYQYSFESRKVTKEIEIVDKDDIAKLLDSKGQHEIVRTFGKN